MLTFSKSRSATSWRSCCMMNAYITATGTSEINRVFDPFSISGGRNMLWVPTCTGHDRKAALRDHYFCYPRPSVLDRNQCPAINFLKETNRSTTISIAKQMVPCTRVSARHISERPTMVCAARPMVACTLGSSHLFSDRNACSTCIDCTPLYDWPEMCSN